MALRRIVSKAVMGSNFEMDLSRSMSSQLDSVHAMVDNMLAPQVFGYNNSKNSGAFAGTKSLSSPASSNSAEEIRLVKVHYPVDNGGLFQDRESWHHVKSRRN